MRPFSKVRVDDAGGAEAVSPTCGSSRRAPLTGGGGLREIVKADLGQLVDQTHPGQIRRASRERPRRPVPTSSASDWARQEDGLGGATREQFVLHLLVVHLGGVHVEHEDEAWRSPRRKGAARPGPAALGADSSSPRST